MADPVQAPKPKLADQMPGVAEFMAWWRAGWEDDAQITDWVYGRRRGYVCATENGVTWCTRPDCPLHGGNR